MRRKSILFIIITLLFCFIQHLVSAQSLNKRDTPVVKRSIKSLLPVSFADYKNDFSQLFNKKLKISNFCLQTDEVYNSHFISSDLVTSDALFQYSAKANFKVELAAVPFKAEYVRRGSNPVFWNSDPRNWYKISMDVESYREKWKTLTQQMGPGILTNSGRQLEKLKSGFAENLMSMGRQKLNNKLHSFLDSISHTINPADLDGKSPASIAQTLFGQDIEEVLNRAKFKLEELKTSALDSVRKDSLNSEWRIKIDELEEKMKYVQRIIQLVNTAKSTGMLNEMKELGSKSKEEFEMLMKNPEALAANLSEKFGIGGIGKILAALSQLKLGGQSLPFTRDQLAPFLGKGLSFELKIADKYLGFSTGKIIPVTNILSLANNPGFPDSSTRAEKPFYWSIHYRKGNLNTNHKGLRLTSISHSGLSNYLVQSANLRKRNTLLIDLFSRERLFGETWLSVEVSKSLANNGNPKDNIFNLRNISFKIALDGRFEKAGITHQLYYNKINGAYNNPVQTYFTSSGYEAGFSFRMRQPKSKFSSYMKARTRNFKVPGSGSNWRSTNLRTGFAYKFRKAQSIQLNGNWQDGYRNYLNNSLYTTIRQQSKGVSADLNLVNKRLFGLYNTSFISMGFQMDRFPSQLIGGGISVSSYSYNLGLNQTFLVREDLWLFNLYYTKVSSGADLFLYNTRLDLDAGGIFKLNEKISAGLSAVYGYFKGAYTNLGIRSSLSVNISKINIEFNGDVRKNLKLENPIFNQFINVNCDIKYMIK